MDTPHGDNAANAGSGSEQPSAEDLQQGANTELHMRMALEESNADNRMIFFAKVLRSANEEDVKQLFSRFGKVYDVNLFRAFQGAPTTKGCGLLTMGTHEEARAAIEGLDSRYCWEGMDSPMVVKWMDAALQRRRREQHLAAMLQGLAPNMAGVPADAWLGSGISAMQRGGAARVGMVAGMAQGLMLPPGEPDVLEVPPTGCQPDTFKLFVGNIPKACTEDQLLPFFESIGKVVELVIVRDKAQQSKGSAFVWYMQRVHAERAILQFNLRHVMPDPTGEQDRPLVVRRARSRATKPLPMGALPSLHSGSGLALGGGLGLAGALGSSLGTVVQAVHSGARPLTQGLTLTVLPASMQQAALGLGHQQQLAVVAGPSGNGVLHNLASGATVYTTTSAGSGSSVSQGLSGQLATVSFAGLEQPLPSQALALQQANAAALGYLQQQQFIGPGGQQYMLQGTLQGGAQLVSIQTAPGLSEAGLYDAYASMSDRASMDRYMVAATSNASTSTMAGGHPVGGELATLAMGGTAGLAGPDDASSSTLSLNLQQLGSVNAHLYSIQSMSGAQLSISPGAHGIFHLLVSGSKPQVDTARSLVSQLLGVAL